MAVPGLPPPKTSDNGLQLRQAKLFHDISCKRRSMGATHCIMEALHSTQWAVVQTVNVVNNFEFSLRSFVPGGWSFSKISQIWLCCTEVYFEHYD